MTAIVSDPAALPGWLDGSVRWAVLPATTCREADCDDGLVGYGTDDHGGREPCPTCDGIGLDPAVAPTLTTIECPTCGGDGLRQVSYNLTGPCPTCDGDGEVTALGLAGEQGVVAWALGVEVLEVVGSDDEDFDHSTAHVCLSEMAAFWGDGDWADLTNEPWAKELRPGDLVVRWATVHPLDPPIPLDETGVS